MQKNQIFIFGGAIVLGIGLYNFLNRPAPVAPNAPVETTAEVTTEPECQVSPQSLNPLINVKAPDVAKVIEDGYSDKLKLYVQHVELKDNTHFEYTEGGCVHFSYELTYSPYVPSQKSSHQIAQDALKELKRPLFLAQDKIDIFTRALDKVLAENDSAVEDEMPLECGDASCTLSVIENKLILSYEMPL